MPSILVETDSIYTEKDALFLKNNQEIIVDALTEVIYKFLKIDNINKKVSDFLN